MIVVQKTVFYAVLCRICKSGTSQALTVDFCQVACRRYQVVATAASPVAPSASVLPASPVLLRPSAAEAARTVVDICTEGTLSTLSQDGWPLGTSVRFAVDGEGNPVFRLAVSALHTGHVRAESRCSLHVQLEQPGRQRPQCTLKGKMAIADASDVMKLKVAWERRFGADNSSDDLYVMNVEEVLQSQDVGEEEHWVTGADYARAVADPLRECAARIVEDMNRKHWEDILRFCKIYARVEAEVVKVSMTWVDRLGFDMQVLTRDPQEIREIRIPFPREVVDERDARSSLTIMAQVAWEQERKYTPADV